MIRVLTVDDSPTARQIISDILSSDPQIEVVGLAKNGSEAVERTKELRPDLVTMDVHMPRMNGFEATKEIMIESPTPIVIVSASTLVHEVAAGMQALKAGALTLLLKPPGPGSPDFDRAANELIETVKAMADVKVVRHRRRSETTVTAPTKQPELAKRISTAFRVVAIAASTGGPPALSCVLGSLPQDFPVPIVLVQHIASGFDVGFARWLDSVVPLSVKISQDGEYLKPGVVYVAGQDHHLGVTRGGRIALSDDPPVGGFRPAATSLFDSVAQAFGENVIAMILTGMGRDGVEGLRSVKQAGGISIAQDEATSVVYGMPGVAVKEGLAGAVLPIEQMSKHLLHLVTRDSKRTK